MSILKMTNFTLGKLKTPIEIQHVNGDVTFCFVFLDNPENLYAYVTSIKDFLPVMILSNDLMYIAKSDIKAFKMFSNEHSQKGYIWSFDPYIVMGVDPEISLKNLHTHYIGLLKQVHPDIIDDKKIHHVFKDIASDITRRIISAYEFIRAEKLSEESNHDK